MNKIWIIIVVGLALSACSPQPAAQETAEPAYTVISQATIAPGDDVPAPAGDVILTISGAIGQTNVDDTLQFDMAMLESLGLVEYRVDDQQAEGRVVTFQGVLLTTLLDVA